MRTSLFSAIATSALVLAGAACNKSDAATSISRGTNGGGNETPTSVGDKQTPAKTQAANDGAWSAEIKSAGAGYKKGSEATFEVVLKSGPDFHINPEYPYKFKVNDEKNVDYAKAEFPKDDGAYALDKCNGGTDNCTLHLLVKFTPKDKASVGGELRFGVCSKDKCKMDKALLALPIEPS